MKNINSWINVGFGLEVLFFVIAGFFLAYGSFILTIISLVVGVIIAWLVGGWIKKSVKEETK